jgi:hypothetical protein
VPHSFRPRKGCGFFLHLPSPGAPNAEFACPPKRVLCVPTSVSGPWRQAGVWGFFFDSTLASLCFAELCVSASLRSESVVAGARSLRPDFCVGNPDSIGRDSSLLSPIPQRTTSCSIQSPHAPACRRQATPAHGAPSGNHSSVRQEAGIRSRVIPSRKQEGEQCQGHPPPA